MFKFSDAEIKRILDAIFDGTITEHALPETLYFAIADYLKKGVYKGFGYSISSLSKEIGKKASNATLEDLELLAELRSNIYMFSAAKTYQQVKEMTGYLVNDDGTVASFKDFKDKAMQTFDLYNKTWLKTEYDTAIGQAQSAMSWQQIQKDADVLPLLEYDAIIDKSTSDICRHMEGIVAPVNDPIWKKYSPLNHFYCRCVLRQHADGDKTPSTNAKKNEAVNAIDPEMQDVFKMNAGMDGYIFKKDHPYFVVPKADKEFAQQNFGLPIPKLDTEAKAPTFEPAKSLKDAEEFAKKVLGCEYVNFKGIHLDIVNDMNRGLFNTKSLMPELDVRGIGNAQECNKAIKKDLIEGYKKSANYENNVRVFGQAAADKHAETVVKRYTEKVGANTLAWSQSKGVVRLSNIEVDLSKYKGVFANEKTSKDKAVVDQLIIRNAKSNWFTRDAKDFSYIMDHELGHEIDKLINFRNDENFEKIFQREHKAGVQAVADRLSKYGATAGNKPEHKRHEMIAESWAEFVTSPSPRELAKEIGELMLKKYYDYFKQGTGTTFTAWRSEALKAIKK